MNKNTQMIICGLPVRERFITSDQNSNSLILNIKLGLQFKNDYLNDILDVYSLDCFIGLKA